MAGGPWASGEGKVIDSTQRGRRIDASRRHTIDVAWLAVVGAAEHVEQPADRVAHRRLPSGPRAARAAASPGQRQSKMAKLCLREATKHASHHHSGVMAFSHEAFCFLTKERGCNATSGPCGRPLRRPVMGCRLRTCCGWRQPRRRRAMSRYGRRTQIYVYLQSSRHH